MSEGRNPTPSTFFKGKPASRRLFADVRAAIRAIGPADVTVGKSQIAFRRRRNFALVWMPEKYLGRGAPLVLTVLLRRRIPSTRWKEVVEPVPGRYTHHLELEDEAEVDGEVSAWLREAYDEAG